MMEKKVFRLYYKVLTPIHIGNNQRDFSNETRYYIPGYTIAGAIIKNYCDLKGKNIEDFYKNKINSLFFTSFFFLKNNSIFYPDVVNKKIGDISINEFENEFLEIKKSTSIEPLSLNALEEHLYEFEYLWEKDLEITGQIEINVNAIDKDYFFKAIQTLQIGAKISKGYGKIVLKSEPVKEKELMLFKDDINLVPVKLNKSIKFKGEIEALSLNRYKVNSGFGQDIYFYGYYIMPGSRITKQTFAYNNYFSISF